MNLINLRDASETDIMATFEASADSDEIAALVAEMDRRERAARKARREAARREAIRSEYAIAQHAAYLAADAACRGTLLSKAGNAKVTDEHALWIGRESVARKYASEELNEWFDANGRLTIGEFTRQRAADAREARAQYREYRDEARRVHALEVAARKVARTIARIARETAKAQRAAARAAKRPALTLIVTPAAVRTVRIAA